MGKDCHVLVTKVAIVAVAQWMYKDKEKGASNWKETHATLISVK